MKTNSILLLCPETFPFMPAESINSSQALQQKGHCSFILFYLFKEPI